MGGKTAQFVALQFPERVDKLIVVDIASKAYPPHHTEILEALSEVDEQQFESRKEAEKFLMPLFPEIGLRQFLLKNLERTPEGVLSVKCNLSLFRSHPERIGKALPEEPKIHTPALFIRGLESSYIEDADLTALQKQYLNFELVSIRNAGHWLHVEQPIVFGEAVAKFLNL
jgi:pimeloyl-ACP methyl ester carboxylesterase